MASHTGAEVRTPRAGLRLPARPVRACPGSWALQHAPSACLHRLCSRPGWWQALHKGRARLGRVVAGGRQRQQHDAGGVRVCRAAGSQPCCTAQLAAVDACATATSAGSSEVCPCSRRRVRDALRVAPWTAAGRRTGDGVGRLWHHCAEGCQRLVGVAVQHGAVGRQDHDTAAGQHSDLQVRLHAQG